MAESLSGSGSRTNLEGGHNTFAFKDGIELIGLEVLEDVDRAGRPANFHTVDRGRVRQAEMRQRVFHVSERRHIAM